jgi:hypothetical protein
MRKADPNELFFDNALDSSEKMLKLEQFLEYVELFLSREARFYDEEAHPDLTREFLPLFAEGMPPILHSAMVMSVGALLEQEMRGYSSALLDATSAPLNFGDLAGSVPERFRAATKMAGLHLDHLEASWQDVVGLFELRNCLVHA